MSRLRSALFIVAAVTGWAVVSAAVSGCGGNKGTLTISLVTPEGSDPFLDAANVHVTVGSPKIMDQTVPVMAGHFDASVKFNPKTSANLALTGPVVVEALNAAGAVIARGQTPSLAFVGQDEKISVWVQRVGTLGVVPAALARPRSAMAISSVPRLGVMFVGGLVGGKPVTDVELFDVNYVQIDGQQSGQATMPPLSSARANAVAIGYDRPASQSVTGALLVAGGSTTPNLDVFDPYPSNGGAPAWLTLGSNASIQRNGATAAILGNGTVLITGGTDDAGVVLKSAAFINTSGTILPQPVSGAMASARVGHTCTAASFSSGDGALLFGGNTDDANSAEAYNQSGQSFAPLPTLAAPTRSGHTATLLDDKSIIIVGGKDKADMVLDSAVLVTTTGPSPAAQTKMSVLTTARWGHTTTLVGGLLLVCGGTDKGGMALNDCERLDPLTLAHKDPVLMGAGRTGHVALALETGTILIAGGYGTDKSPLTSLELYTP